MPGPDPQPDVVAAIHSLERTIQTAVALMISAATTIVSALVTLDWLGHLTLVVWLLVVLLWVRPFGRRRTHTSATSEVLR